MDPGPTTEAPDDGFGWNRTEKVLRVLAACVGSGTAAERLGATADLARRLGPHGIPLGLHAAASAGRVLISVTGDRPDPSQTSLLSIEPFGDRIHVERRHPGRPPLSFDFPATRGLEPVLEEMVHLAQMRSWHAPEALP